MVIAPLGLWIALHTRAASEDAPARRRRYWLGGILALLGLLYLVFVIKVAIPFFRGGDVHYVRYFPQELGDTPGEMVVTVLTRPLLVAKYLLSLENLLFALSLLVPLGGLSLFSLSRLAVALPLFGVLCLNQIAQNTQHHFHAPLLPIVIWAAAAGLRALRVVLPALGISCAVTTGLLFSLTPTGIAFWDPFSAYHWSHWYVPGERAAKFSLVTEQIPQDAIVASTDYIHPRFTHQSRSYDYSDYRPKVPSDADYIVIDTQHRYSRIKIPQEVKEYRDTPQAWELLPDRTGGYFIILKRRR